MPTVEKLKKGETRYVTPYPGRGRPSRERKALRDAEVAAGYLIPDKPLAAKPSKPSQKRSEAAPAVVKPLTPPTDKRAADRYQANVEGTYRTLAKNLAAAAMAEAEGKSGPGAVLTVATCIARLIERERAGR